jgi:hypothetical protein
VIVVDASVALKWFLKARDDEAHIENALTILAGIDTGRVQMLQAPHFLAEVAADQRDHDTTHEIGSIIPPVDFILAG